MKLNIFSDLRRPGLVPGESLSLAQNYVFCFGETSIYIMSNRMRSLHKQSILYFHSCILIYPLPWKVSHNKIHNQFSYRLTVLVISMKYMSQNSKQCKVSQFWNVYGTGLAYSGILLGLFQFGTISATFVYMVGQILGIVLSNSYLYLYWTLPISYHSTNINVLEPNHDLYLQSEVPF